MLGNATSDWMLVTAFNPRLAEASAEGSKISFRSSEVICFNSSTVRRSPSTSSPSLSSSRSLRPREKFAATAVGFSASFTKSSSKKPKFPVAWKSSLSPKPTSAEKLVVSVLIKKPNSSLMPKPKFNSKSNVRSALPSTSMPSPGNPKSASKLIPARV